MTDGSKDQPELLPVRDPVLLSYLEQRIARTAEEFGIDPSGFPRPVLIVERQDDQPEFRLFKGGACLIFITTTSDWHRARYQLAHEVVHGVLSPIREPVFDWVQEMFAMHVSVRAMRELGEYLYAARCEARSWENAQLMTRKEMLEIDLQPPYPRGLHNQAFVTGCELIDQIGWERLKLLGTQMTEDGRHDIDAWVELLDSREQAGVRRVLSTSTRHEESQRKA